MIHYLKNISLLENAPDKFKEIVFGAGCFWGVEKQFWDLPGVYNTLVGYSGGDTEDPTYEDVCYKETNHAEVVKIVYDPVEINLEDLLKIFWECHDPTQGMRQGTDVGTQYRSTIYTSDDSDLSLAKDMKDIYQSQLEKNNLNKITTEIEIVKNFYLAEEYHQHDGYERDRGHGPKFPKEPPEILFKKAENSPFLVL